MIKKMIKVVSAGLMLLSITGCGKSTIEWSPGEIKVNGKVIDVTEYREVEAEKVIEDVGTAKFYICDDISMSPNNHMMFSEDQLDKFKDAKYYTASLDTDVGMYLKYGKQYLEGYMLLKGTANYTLEQTLNELYNTMSDLKFVPGIKEIKLSENVTLKSEGWDWKLRKNEVVIPNVLRVKADDGSVTATESVSVGDATIGKMTGKAFEYYQYDGLVFQVPLGQNIEDLISFE